MIARSAAFLLPLLLANPAFAQEAPAPVDPAPNTIDPAKLDGDSITIGAAAGIGPSYEGSNDTVLSVVPGIRSRVSQINFTLRGNRFFADLIPTPGGPGWDFQLGPVAQINFNRSTSAIKDPRVEAIGKIKSAIEVGGIVGIAKQGVLTSDYDRLGVSFIYAHDAGGVHKSYTMTPAIDYGTPLSRKAYVGISASANYMGQGYATRYFSIAPGASVRSGLPVYNARKGWKDWTLGTVGMLALTGDLTGGLSMIGAASYRRLLGSAAETPLTSIAGSRDQWTGMLGLAYTF
ncbi:MAG: MipA/OmpV family protein [Sphingomonadales bacterium]|nr:MAG: MipA/OmpV family protein [Sphingomonadales bacterium]